jgi:hypothetical protein
LSICCFIGHRTIYNIPAVKERVKDLVQGLIENGVKTFYNGGMGKFDALCASAVHDLKREYGDLNNVLISPYPKVDKYKARLFDEVIYPSLEKVHPKYAILYRNKYMVDNSAYAITYVTHPWGGAAQTLEYAKKRGLYIINAADTPLID